MTREQAKEIVKKSDPSIFFIIAPKTYNGKPTYVCPTCGNGSGEDGTGFHEDPARPGRYHCFKCGKDGDLLEFIAPLVGYSTTTKAVFDYAYQELGLEVEGVEENAIEQWANREENAIEARTKLGENANEQWTNNGKMTKEDQDIAAYIDECSTRLEAVKDYLASRGLDEKTAKRFKLGYDPCHYFTRDRQEHPSLIIPTSETTYISRNLDPGEKDARWTAQGKRIPLNLEILDSLTSTDTVYITEGELDAISVEALGYHAIGLGGQGQTKLMQKLKGLHQPPCLLLALDNDGAGRALKNRLSTALREAHIPFKITNIAGEYKDPNEALVEDREGLLERLEAGKHLEAIKKIRERNAQANLEGFFDAIRANHYVPVCKTGWASLDSTLDGGIHWGLYILGAISSLGKTSFMLQMMDQIAMQGVDVLIISLEMSRHELIAKSLSRETFEKSMDNEWDKDTALSARAIMDYRRWSDFEDSTVVLLESAKERYATYANHVYIYEGQGSIKAEDLKSIVEEHIEVTGNRPVVMLDYLQLVAPQNDRWSERQNIDHAVSTLRVLSRDYRIPIFAVSSIGRASYGMQEASLSAFKESGGIEYGADAAFMLKFSHRLVGKDEEKKTKQAEHERENKMRDPRLLELVILKNRNGKTGDSIELQYYPKFNTFFDEPNENWKAGLKSWSEEAAAGTAGIV